MKRSFNLVPLIVIVVLVAGLGVLIGWRMQQRKIEQGQKKGGRGAAMARGGAATVETTTPQFRDIVKTFTATGNVEAMDNVKIASKISGVITGIKVREGSRVKPGDELVRIDQANVTAQVNAQKANLAQAQARLAQARMTQSANDAQISTQIQQAQANLTQAKSRYEQARLTQSTTDTTVQTQIDQQAAALASAIADLKQTESARDAQLESIKATVEDAQNKLEVAKVAVANANISQRSAQANLDNATTKYNRTNDLYKQGYVAAQDVDDARTTLNVQQAALDTAKGQVQAALAAQNSAAAQFNSAKQLASVNRTKLDADKAASEAKAAQAKAALEAAKANQQQKPAYQQNLAALQAQVDQAQAALENAKANGVQKQAYQENINALSAVVNAAQAQLDSANSQLADTVLKAPVAGVVTARSQDPGSLASPGQAILTLQSVDSLWVTIAVPEDVYVKTHLAQPATIAFDALGGTSFPGRVAQINPAADPDSRQFTVRVAFDNRDGRFTPGMFGKVTLETDRVMHALSLPIEPIKTDTDGSKYVFVMQTTKDDQGKDTTVARKTPVVVGVSDGAFTEITSGLDPKTTVITGSAMTLRDGQPVSLKPAGGPGGRGGGSGRPGGGGRPGGAQGQTGGEGQPKASGAPQPQAGGAPQPQAGAAAAPAPQDRPAGGERHRRNADGAPAGSTN